MLGWFVFVHLLYWTYKIVNIASQQSAIAALAELLFWVVVCLVVSTNAVNCLDRHISDT